MKRTLPLFLYFFSLFSVGQDQINIQDKYLGEILSVSETRSLPDFNIDDIQARKDLVAKITSYDYLDPSYLKTNMVLNMLKYKLGDENYNEAVKSYVLKAEYEPEGITLAGFRAELEEVSGIDLGEFFSDWFDGKGYPTYEISWFQNEKNRDINIVVNQTQSDRSVAFFEMPLPILVSNEEGDRQVIRLEISENKQTFTGFIPFKITSVEIDPDAQLITKNNIVKTGVDQEALNASITLFPNPAKNLINIQNMGNAVVERVSIFNMLGKLVLVEDNPIAAIDLKPLQFGIHLVKIETTQGTLHKTILKE